jgi:predicted N-acyltransferase
LSSSPGLEVQIVHSVEAVEPAAWDRLAGGRPFHSHRWYRFGERALAEDEPVYVLVTCQGEPVARATFWLTAQPALPVPSRALRQVLQAIFRRRPLLMCRSPLADVSGLILPDGPPRADVLDLILQAAGEWARRQRVSFIVFDYLTEAEAREPDWPAGAARAAIPDPGTHLQLGWPDFEAFLGGLGQSARRHYRQHARRAAEQGVAVRVYPAVPDLTEALALIGNVERRFDSAFPWARRALENMSMVNADWIAAEAGGRVAASGLLLRDGAAALVTLVGRDYQVPYAYFQMYYAAIERAVRAGAGGLRGGSGAYEFKQRLGFELLTNNHVRYVPANRALGALARLAA